MKAMTRMTLQLGIVALIGASTTAQQTYPIFGLGIDSTCGDLIKAKEQRSANDTATYAALLSWMQGFVTGAGLDRSTGDLIWDGIVLAGIRDEAARNDLKAARTAYCRDNTKDPICSIWTNTPVASTADAVGIRNAERVAVVMRSASPSRLGSSGISAAERTFTCSGTGVDAFICWKNRQVRRPNLWPFRETLVWKCDANRRVPRDRSSGTASARMSRNSQISTGTQQVPG